MPKGYSGQSDMNGYPSFLVGCGHHRVALLHGGVKPLPGLTPAVFASQIFSCETGHVGPIVAEESPRRSVAKVASELSSQYLYFCDF